MRQSRVSLFKRDDWRLLKANLKNIFEKLPHCCQLKVGRVACVKSKIKLKIGWNRAIISTPKDYK